MKYLEIAVFTKTKNTYDTFTYKINSESKVEIGQIVKVPFKNRALYGIVLDNNEKKPEFETREVLEVLDESLSLPKHLIETAFFINEYYSAPLSSALKTMLPGGFYKKRQGGSAEKSSLSTALKINPVAQKFISPKLTPDQKKIIEKIKNSKDNKPFLLHGVTGSGKTEIYLQIIEKALKEGKGAIVLVPEVALTPQTIKRFEERFPNKISVLHSYLKETERQKNWSSLASGEKQIAIGSRSAIFAPIKNLGVIVLDEEHEISYKQENSPRYEAGKVARFISKKTNARLILGSATPRVESFYKAKNEEYHYLSLNKRIFQEKMPDTKIVDMSKNFQKGSMDILSGKLLEKIKSTLNNKRKVILFLNRRGNATFVFCRNCGYVEKCPNCELPLIYHLKQDKGILLCHHCNYKKITPKSCPTCGSNAIKYFGLGVQKAESEIKRLFPGTKVLRMDKDTTQKRGAHKEIYEEFLKKEECILIGTQMISKGWDIPEVDLVGVISVDNALNFPDFRSNERVFQLLTQISGRTGRKDNPGEVIIQTYNPDNHTILCSKNHDYQKFYEKEISEREQFFYPPFSKLIKIEFKNQSSEKTKEEALKMKLSLEKWLKKNYNEVSVKILGPSPSFIPRVNNYYRWQIILKFKPSEAELINKFLKDSSGDWTVDTDPIILI